MIFRWLTFGALASLVLVGTLAKFVLVGAAQAGDPSFKTAADKNADTFKTRVFTKIVKSARTQPGTITLDKGTYEDIEKGRKELTLTGSYKGAVLKKKYDVTIVIRLDTTKDEWRVLKITYSDTNTLAPSVRDSVLATLAKKMSE